MHYIRLLRPPSIDKKENLKLVLTITTDLGDSFLCPQQSVPISVCAHFAEPPAPEHHDTRLKIDDGSNTWRTGMRVLKLDLQLPSRVLCRIRANSLAFSGSARIKIVPWPEHQPDPPSLAEVPFDTDGRILGLSVPFPVPGQETCYTATRDFEGSLSFDEDIGESIDRHVWDAGIVTAGLILDMCADGTGTKWTKTPLLRSILKSASAEAPLNVIELGCGVGILGIGLATALAARILQHMSREAVHGAQSPPQGNNALNGSTEGLSKARDIGSILLTDLPDAEELTNGNILRYRRAQRPSGLGSMQLEFESLDWEDGRSGTLGPKASATGCDLVIISDCTYNVDMLSALVDTLSAIHTSSVGLGKAGPKVMLATKPRHSSERTLFDLMAAQRWHKLESATQPLPVLGLDDETVELYLFGKP